MSETNPFEKLLVWQKSHQLTLTVYKLVKGFPQDERFGLSDQLRHSTSAVPTNIVEGNSRKGKKEYLQYLNISFSSLQETKYHLLLARDLEYINKGDYDQLINLTSEISKMLSSLIKYLKSEI